MGLPAVKSWIIRAMDVYDKQGLYPGCSIFAQVQSFAAEVADATHSEMLEEVSGVLELFVCGLSGRGLRLEAGDAAYTDTDMLYLPARLSGFVCRQDNYRLYKALTAHGWAQTWYGSFRLPEGELLSARFAAFPDPDRAQRLFHALETARLDACLARDLPGLYRDMQELQMLAGGWQAPAGWTLALKRLQKTSAGVHDSLALMAELYAGELPTPRCYQGRLFAERVEKTLYERLARARRTPSVRRSPTSTRKRPARPSPGMRRRVSRSNASLTPRSPRAFVSRSCSTASRWRRRLTCARSWIPSSRTLARFPTSTLSPPATAVTGARTRTPSVPRTSGKAPTTKKAHFCTTSGTTSARTTASTGAAARARRAPDARTVRATHARPARRRTAGAAQDLRGAAWREPPAQEATLRRRRGLRRTSWRRPPTTAPGAS